ncbi:MAG TPA: hypothetical protein VEU62_21970 [Bryobacterales bacterium]|nr:hypothetical protein [Bryobacterales bacterium]
MSLKLYIAYGTGADQVVALRLQALAAVNGLGVYVPPAHTRDVSSPSLDPQSATNLHDANVVLGVITTAISEACRQELNTAKTLGKTTIVIAEPAQASRLEPYFPGSVVAIDPADPARAEKGIVWLLKKAEMEQDSKKALIALGTLALGLLLLAPQD